MADSQLNFVDFDAQVSTKDLSCDSASFLWLALLKDVLIELPHYEHHITNEHNEASAKQEMVNQLRLFHANNSVQLKKVDEFEEFYDCKEMAVYLYSKDACIHQPINIALRTKDVDALVSYRYFISHLCSDLTDRCTKYHQDHPHSSAFHVYRGQILSAKEIDRLRTNINNLIAMNGFCATSRDKTMAVKFARNVLFDIKVDLEKHPALIFADIAHHSQFEEEKEVLFDLSTVFRIEKVVDENDSLTCIYLSASSEGRELVDIYLTLQRAEMPEFNLVMMFGRLLCFMGDYAKAHKYFTYFLENSGEDKPSLHHNLAFVHDKQQNFDEALQHYEEACSLLQQADPPRVQELAVTLNNMAAVFSQRGEHEQALHYLVDSLAILKEFHTADHIGIAGAYNNLGNVYRDLGEFETSLENHRLAHEMYKRVGLPAIHPDMADCIQNLAMAHHNLGEFDVARTLYEEALAIRRQCQLGTHPDIASNLNDIGYLLCDAGQTDEGFTYFEKAYELRIANQGTSRVDLADSFNNMGVVNRHRDNLASAIEFYIRALTIYEAALPPDHEIIANTRNNLELAKGLELSMKSNNQPQ
ncbi:unnamed protein product [Rotaria socialis]|uniref:NAD(P)(+)--arginine ADP-ribosyltransferase n=2 Tax=Rotaria socialis TaxID=392032 RepID=A0A817PQA4_9BILA|nr:unnamed protein product [Rotaria socialis]